MPSARSATAAPRRSSAPRRRATASASAGIVPVRIRWDKVGRVVLIVVLAVVSGLIIQRGVAYLRVRSQADQQRAIVERLVRDNAQLAREAKSLNNSATIQRDARGLGMIRPGERPYVVTGLPGN